jgi:hypothetical protein
MREPFVTMLIRSVVLIKTESARWDKVARAAGIRLE